jgi:hypothetical protein
MGPRHRLGMTLLASFSRIRASWARASAEVRSPLPEMLQLQERLWYRVYCAR